jgi:hypothetical protein
MMHGCFSARCISNLSLSAASQYIRIVKLTKPTTGIGCFMRRIHIEFQLHVVVFLFTLLADTKTAAAAE